MGVHVDKKLRNRFVHPRGWNDVYYITQGKNAWNHLEIVV